MAERTNEDGSEPTQVFTHVDDQGKQMWGWRCSGGVNCEGWIGRDLYSQEAAHSEMDRHVAEEHKGAARG